MFSIAFFLSLHTKRGFTKGGGGGGIHSASIDTQTKLIIIDTLRERERVGDGGGRFVRSGGEREVEALTMIPWIPGTSSREKRCCCSQSKSS